MSQSMMIEEGRSEDSKMTMGERKKTLDEALKEDGVRLVLVEYARPGTLRVNPLVCGFPHLRTGNFQ